MTSITKWFDRNGPRFALAAIIVAVVVVSLGWFTDLRDVMHYAILAVFGVAFLPFILLAGVIALVLLVALVAALAGGEAGVDAPIGSFGEEWFVGFTSWYYGRLARIRHPFMWGIPAGLLLGALCVWGLLTMLVAPREAKTLQTLAESQEHIEAKYEQDGEFPEPVDGQLHIDGEPVLDGFGNPVLYDISGVWKLRAFTLRSLGADEERSDDDLCMRGGTKWREATEKGLLAAVEKLGGGESDLGDRIGHVLEFRCGAE